MIRDPAFIFAVALAAGMVAQVVAVYLKMPGIVVLLITGLLLGPDVIGIVQPDGLGDGLGRLVDLAVAVILFDGALNLNLERIRREAVTIRRLMTVGALVSLVGGMLATRLFLGWSWTVSMLFGVLVVVTGPTVINPLLRRIRVQRNVDTILTAEGVLMDPVGAIMAVVALEVVVTAGPLGLVGLPSRLLVGAAIGAVSGLILTVTFRHNLVPDELENVFILAMVLATFEISNVALDGSGILTSVVAGLVVGNFTGAHRTLREFKEQLTVMLVGLLFVLLAADVRLVEVTDLGLGGLAVVLSLMFIVRPIGVALSTTHSELTYRERIFIAWIGPRGIVAAAMASFFALQLQDAGFEGGNGLRALVFSVIALTVVVQGITGGPVATLLGVRRPKDTGYVIVGANPIGRTLGRLLMDGGEEVILIDSNPAETARAEEQGLRTILGNAHEEQVLILADVEGRHGLASVTTNESINLLLARKAREEFRVPNAYAALSEGKPGMALDQVRDVGASTLFARPIDLDEWNRTLEQGDAVIESYRYAGDSQRGLSEGLSDAPVTAALLPMGITRDGSMQPADDKARIRDGDIVTFACRISELDAAREALREAGWSRTETTAEAYSPTQSA